MNKIVSTTRVFAFCFLTGCGLLFVCCGADLGGYQPVGGDVVFQSFPHDPLTDTIEGVSQSPYSHCGIVLRENGNWSVIEAVGPVMITPLEDWVARGRGHAFAVYRLREKYRKLTPQMIEAAKTFLGRPYDIHYAMGDDKIYCSELVFKAFRKASGEDPGKLQKLGDLNWKPYEVFIRKIEEGQLPLDREMITPRELYEAPQLEKIFSKGFAP